MRAVYAIGGGVAIGALIAGTYLWTARQGQDLAAMCGTTTVASGEAAIGGPFTLVREDGVTVTDADVFTEPTLLYFGYTFCPDVCPLDNVRNAQALDLLAERGVEAQMAMISIDPARDTPEVMADWTDYIHEDFIGLTGSDEQVRAASAAYRTYYQRQPGDDEFYLVDHSTFTYLVMPETGFVEFFRRDTTPEAMAETVACFAGAGT